MTRGPTYVRPLTHVTVVGRNHGVVPHKPSQQTSVHNGSHRGAGSNSLKLPIPTRARWQPQLKMNVRLGFGLQCAGHATERKLLLCSSDAPWAHTAHTSGLR